MKLRQIFFSYLDSVNFELCSILFAFYKKSSKQFTGSVLFFVFYLSSNRVLSETSGNSNLITEKKRCLAGKTKIHQFIKIPNLQTICSLNSNFFLQNSKKHDRQYDILVSIIYAVPGQPQNQSVKRTSEEIYLQWSSRGHVEYYNVSAWCNKVPKPTISHLGNETTANITGLMPGTHCSVIIIGFAGGFPSIPLNYTDIETIEKGNANECSLIVKSEFSFIKYSFDIFCIT